MPTATPTARSLQALSSDERLAKRAKGGDSDAFAAIFSRYQRDLYRFCVGILGEPQDAQDAIQNTMLKVMRSLPGERREIQLKPWLYRIAHNEAVELRRRARPAEELEPEIADGELSVEDRAERSERLRTLFRDMADLPERQRAALVMRELNGLEFGEIGDALGTSPSAVRQALYEARRGLQQMDLGRQMDCEAVARVLSDEDGRRRVRRDIRAHLRDCPECRSFRDEIGDRKQALAAISPLPAFALGALLKSLLGGSGGGGVVGAGGGAAGLAGDVAVKSALTSGLAKSVAGVLAVVAIGTAAADRTGVIHFPGERRGTAVEREAGAAGAPQAAVGRPALVPARRSGGGANAVPAVQAVHAVRVAVPTAVPGGHGVDSASAFAVAEPARQRLVDLGNGSGVPAVPSPTTEGSQHLPADPVTGPATTDQPRHPSHPEHPQQAAQPPAEDGGGSASPAAEGGEPSQPAHPVHPVHPEKGPKAGQPEKGPKSESEPVSEGAAETAAEPGAGAALPASSEPSTPPPTAAQPTHPEHPAHPEHPEHPAHPEKPAAEASAAEATTFAAPSEAETEAAPAPAPEPTAAEPPAASTAP